MIIACPPIMHLAAARIFHGLAHLRHASRHVVRRTSGSVKHVFKTAISPHLTTGFACKMGSTAIVAGSLLTGLPTNTPLGLDRAISSGDGISRSSPSPSENSGTLEQASQPVRIVGSGSASMFPAIEPGDPTPYAAGDGPAYPDPFAFHGPSLFAGPEVAWDLRTVLSELPPDLVQGSPGGDPDSPVTALSEAPVDEPPSGLILLAALFGLSLRRSNRQGVCHAQGGDGL
jgi:hypothetical protein